MGLKKFEKVCIICGTYFPIKGKLHKGYEVTSSKQKRQKSSRTCSKQCAMIFRDRKRHNEQMEHLLGVKR